jgi:hypothetical protein
MPIPIIYRTVTLLTAVQAMPTHRTFLRDRYFPVDLVNDIFPGEEVLVEYRKGSKKIAPVVMPRKGGITIEREGYKTKSYIPPTIAPSRPLTIDDLNKKGFGEALYSRVSPEQRQAQILNNDLSEFDLMISGREEEMAAQAMLNNEIVLKQYADKYGGSNFEEYVIRFYEGDANPSVYTPAVAWGQPGDNKLADIKAMIRMLTSKGLPAKELVLNPDLADLLINDEKVQKLFDNQRINIGKIDPIMLPEGAAHIGTINVDGRSVDIISYDETYEDEDGVNKYYLPSGYGVLSAPGAGHTSYGAVTQLEQDDETFHTYEGRRVPKYTADVKANVRELQVTSRPLLIPKNECPWVTLNAFKK